MGLVALASIRLACCRWWFDRLRHDSWCGRWIGITQAVNPSPAQAVLDRIPPAMKC